MQTQALCFTGINEDETTKMDAMKDESINEADEAAYAIKSC